jgi:hypothetical protein
VTAGPTIPDAELLTLPCARRYAHLYGPTDRKSHTAKKARKKDAAQK